MEHCWLYFIHYYYIDCYFCRVIRLENGLTACLISDMENCSDLASILADDSDSEDDSDEDDNDTDSDIESLKSEHTDEDEDEDVKMRKTNSEEVKLVKMYSQNVFIYLIYINL